MKRDAKPPRSFVIAMLMAVVVISSVDKLIFAFAGPSMIRDLGLTPVQFGFAGSAFFFLYSVSGILVGLLTRRVQARWLLLAMSAVWACAQFIVTQTSQFATLVGSRLLLGAGTGPGTAVTQHAAFKWFRHQERITAATLIQISLMLGGLLAGGLLPLAIERCGWRACYLALGWVSVAWCVLWLIGGREGCQDAAEEGTAAERRNLSYRALLLDPAFLVVTAIGFIGYLPNVLGFSWLAVYLQQGLGLSAGRMAVFLTGQTVVLIALSLTVSRLCQRALAKGASFRRAMVVPPMLACMLGGLSFTLLAALPGAASAKLGLYAVGAVAVNLLPSFGFTIVGHLAPPDRRGSMLAIHNGVVTSAGVVAPALIGWLVTRAGGDVARGMETFFLALGLVAAVAGFGAAVLLDPDRRRRLRAKEMVAAAQ